jgi:hypothetical protein
MYSIKPGRGPSAAGVVGSIIAAVFGVIWTAGAASMGAPGVFIAFGVVFVLAAIGGGIYNLYNATATNRVSHFDIVHASAEPDPLSPRISNARTPSAPITGAVSGFCPFCGNGLAPEFAFCPKCGKAVPPTS